jgi:hypothetical protein
MAYAPDLPRDRPRSGRTTRNAARQVRTSTLRMAHAKDNKPRRPPTWAFKGVLSRQIVWQRARQTDASVKLIRERRRSQRQRPRHDRATCRMAARHRAETVNAGELLGCPHSSPIFLSEAGPGWIGKRRKVAEGCECFRCEYARQNSKRTLRIERQTA